MTDTTTSPIQEITPNMIKATPQVLRQLKGIPASRV